MDTESDAAGETVNRALAGALETAVNGYLRADPDAETSLQPLHGKVICLHLTAPELTFFLQPGAGGVRVRDTSDSDVDVTIRASVVALVQAARSGAGAAAEQELHLEGDMHTARALQRVLRQLDIDPEELLSRVVGDIPAHQIGKLVRAFKTWGRGAADSLALSGSEFLLYESAMLTSRDALDRFLGDVDHLRADVDRLEARIDRLHRGR